MSKKTTKKQRISIPYDKLTLANNFMFYKVMRNHPDACKKLLEMLLNIRIKHMTMATEETIKIDLDAKSIRLDVYVTEQKRMHDIELQVVNTQELPERARFYAATMDLDSLKSGDKYTKLRDSHVVFICMQDVFKNGLPVNTFENICQEDGVTKLNDRSYKHFFIAPRCAKMIEDEEVRSFFEFLISNKAKTKYTTSLSNYVEDARHNTQWRLQYMTWERQRAYDFDEGKEAGLIEGREEGAQQKAVETAINMLKRKYPVNDISEITNLPVEKVLELQQQLSSKA